MFQRLFLAGDARPARERRPGADDVQILTNECGMSWEGRSEETATDLLARLRGVTSVALRGRDEASVPPTSMWGTGRVAVEAEPGGGVLFHEAGRVERDAAAPMGVRNAIRWRLGPAASGTMHIELARRRAGRWEPLVRLVPAGRGCFRGCRPYRCGQDRYEATLRVTRQGLRLRWVIRGPSKRQVVTCDYR